MQTKCIIGSKFSKLLKAALQTCLDNKSELKKKMTVLLRLCDSFKPMQYTIAPVRYLTKKRETCIIGLKTNKSFREALEIYLENSSKN